MRPTFLAGALTSSSPGVLCVVLVAAFHLLTIREGEDWHDDFSMYIHHARNIAEGAPYGQTGYIYNPHNPSVGPRVYPPGFPLLLAPLVKLFGLDLRPMKVQAVLFLLGSLLMVLELFRGVLAPAYLNGLVLVMGLNPFFWELKDHVLSDLPFLFFVLLSLCLAMRADEADTSLRRRATWAALAGLAAYASYATRTLGIVLPPCFVLHDLIRHRRVTVVGGVAGAIFAALAGVQHIFWVRDTSYLDQFAVTAAIIRRNAVDYLRALSDLWDNGHSAVARKAAFLAAGGLAACGYVGWLRARASLLALFPWLYLAPIVLWPSYQGTRFLVPVLPFYLACCLCGVQWMEGALGRRRARLNVSLPAVLAVVAVIYVGRYSTLPHGRLPQGIASHEGLELFEFVRTATDPGDVFLFSKPRALALFTGRRASAAFSPADPCELWHYIAEIGASYVVAGPDALNADVVALHRFVGEFQSDLRLVLENEDLAVYRIERNPCLPGPEG